MWPIRSSSSTLTSTSWLDWKLFSALILCAGVLITLPAPGWALDMINNGLAPPDPTNVLDDDSYLVGGEKELHVRNAGCPPLWPSGSASASCLSPGAPTEYSIVTGAEIGSGGPGDPDNAQIRVHDTSMLEMSGGQVVGVLHALGSASVTVTGGSVGSVSCSGSGAAKVLVAGGVVDGIVAFEGCSIDVTGGTLSSNVYSNFVGTAPVRISGGAITGLLFGTNLTVAGDNFKLDGIPVGYGTIAGSSEVLTGDLLFGGSINAQLEGTVTLAANLDPVEVPGLAGAFAPCLALVLMRTGLRLERRADRHHPGLGELPRHQDVPRAGGGRLEA